MPQEALDFAIATLASAGGASGVLWTLARVVAPAIARVYSLRSEAAHAEAEAKRIVAQRDDRLVDTLAEQLEDFRRRLDACEQRHAAAEKRMVEAQQSAKEALKEAREHSKEIGKLKRAVARREKP